MNIPKNIRQMGTPSESLKIFVEDYVITYLHQLAKEKMPGAGGACLLGESSREGNTVCFFVRSAVWLEDLIGEGGVPVFADALWKELYEKQARWFPEQQILGWFLSVPGSALQISEEIRKCHRDHFAGRDKVLWLEDPAEGEEDFFVSENENLAQQEGFFIFYEKNEEMQQYMLEQKDGKSVDEGVIFTDRAARSFRMLVQEKREQSYQKHLMSWLYGASTFLILVVLIIGITMLNNYEKMEKVEMAVRDLTENLEEPAESAGGSEEVREAAGFAEAAAEEVTSEEPEPVPEEEPPEAEAETAAAENTTFYIVKPGDTLLGISRTIYGTDQYIDRICELNGIEDSNRILIGEKILLP